VSTDPLYVCPQCGMAGTAVLHWQEHANAERPSCRTCGHDLGNVTPEPEDDDAPKKKPKSKAERILLPWHSAPPQTMPERLQAAQDLSALVIETPAADYETFGRYFVTCCYALSGPELDRLARRVISILREAA
jgi:hypothetical protein